MLDEMFKFMSQLELIKVFDFPFPVYILMAGVEKIVDPKKTILFYEKVNAPAKEIQIMPGFYHEIFNEVGQDKAFEALTACIRQSGHS